MAEEDDKPKDKANKPPLEEAEPVCPKDTPLPTGHDARLASDVDWTKPVSRTDKTLNDGMELVDGANGVDVLPRPKTQRALPDVPKPPEGGNSVETPKAEEVRTKVAPLEVGNPGNQMALPVQAEVQPDAGTKQFLKLLSMTSEHTAPPAALNADKTFKEGQFEGADGSKIQFSKLDDGQIRPVSITYKDGSSTKYDYENGIVTKVTNFDSDKKELSSFVSEDGGESYDVRIKSNDKSETVLKEAKASVTVRADGTWQFDTKDFATEKRGRHWERNSDGKIVQHSKLEGEELLSAVGPGRQIVHFKKIGDQLQPIAAVLPDGAAVAFLQSSEKNKSVKIFERGNQIEYETTDGGTTWKDKQTGNVGKLELKQGYIPEFKPSGEKVEAVEQQKPNDQLTDVDKDRARTVRLQDKLGSLLEAVYQPKIEAARKQAFDDGMKSQADGKKVDHQELKKQIDAAQAIVVKQMEADREKLKSEMALMRGAKDPAEAWKQCDTTQKLYKDTVNWLQDNAIPQSMKRLLGAHGRDVPPGSQCPVPKDENGVFLSLDLFKSRVGNDDIPHPDFGIEGTKDKDTRQLKLPSSAEIDSITKGLKFVSDVQQRSDRERRDFELNIAMPDLIRANGLPTKWLEDAGRDPKSQLPALREMVKLATTARNYTTAMSVIGLEKLGLTEFPPGCKPEYEGKKLVRINMDLPKDLDMQGAKNLLRAERLTEWITKNGPKIDQALETYAKENQANAVFYGEIEMKAKVLSDASGKALEIFDPKDPRNLEKSRDPKSADLNLLSCDYQVRTENGKIFLDYQVQPKEAEFYQYLNIGAKNVSNPFVDTKGPYDANDPIAIRDSSGKIKLILAKEAETERTFQKWAYWGDKGLTLAMDGGMAIAALGSGGGALAANSAWKLAAAGARLGLATSGIFLNNAWARTDENWALAGEVRGLLMVADVTQGTMRHLGGAALKFARGGAEVAGAVDVIKEAAMASNWLIRTGFKAGHAAEIGMEVTNLVYAPIILHDIGKQWKVIEELNDSNPFERAQRMVKEGRDVAMQPVSPAEKAKDELASAKRQLDLYADQLTRGKDADAQKSIRDVFDRAKDCLDPATPAEKREKLKTDMLDLLYGSRESAGSKIASAESFSDTTATPEAIRTQRGDNVANADLRAAAAAALLFLQNDEKNPSASYGQREITIPAHSMGNGEDRYTVPERKVTQSMKREELLALVKEDVCATDSTARRVINGELLVRSQARPPISQAAILRDAVSDPNSTKSDKLNAILQLTPMINSLQLLEAGGKMSPAERQAFIAHSHGVTPADLQKALQLSASNPAESADVRAMAAAMLHTLRTEFEPKAINAAVAKYAKAFVESKGNDTDLKKEVLDRLTVEKDSADPLTRMRATLTLRDMGDIGGLSDHKAFNKQLMRSFDSTKPEVAQLALEHLIIKDAALDLNAADRKRILNFLEETAHPSNVALKLLIASRISDFAVDDDDKMQARGALERFLKPAGDRISASEVPELRIAAIRGLGQLNSAGSVSVIEKFGKTSGERDERVRLAAVEALEKLHAPGLGPYVIDALKTESDFAIRAKLINARSQNVRPIRDAAYFEQLQGIQASLEEATKNNYDDPAAHSWFVGKPEFSLLTTAGYDKEFERRVTNLKDISTSQSIDVYSTKADLQESARVGLEIDRNNQMIKLGAKARENSEEGHHARMMLLSFVFEPGRHTNEGTKNDEAKKAKMTSISERAAGQIKQACETGSEVRGELLKGIRLALKNETIAPGARLELLEALNKFVDSSSIGPARAMDDFMADPKKTNTDAVLKAYSDYGRKDVPRELQDAMREYEKEPAKNLAQLSKVLLEQKNEFGSALYRQIASVAILDGMKAQASKLSKPDEPGYHAEVQLQKKMIDLLVKYQFRDSYAALEAYASKRNAKGEYSHPHAEVRETAQRAITDLRDRVLPKWDATKSDTTTSVRQRAQTLEMQLLKGDGDDLAQALFTAYKGMPIKAGDERIVAYQRALRDGGAAVNKDRPDEISKIDGAPKVALAAARVILDRDEKGGYANSGFSDEDRREALRVVGRIASEAVSPTHPAGYQQDASMMLAAEIKHADARLFSVAFRDMFMSDAKLADRPLTVDGKPSSLRQLWIDSFKAEASALPGGTGEVTVNGDRGPMKLAFENGELLSSTELRDDGTRVTTRRVGKDLVIEHLRGNSLVQAVPPAGKTYARVLVNDLTDYKQTDEARLDVAQRLLTDTNVKATETEREHGLQSLKMQAVLGTQASKFKFAEYLAVTGPIAADKTSPYRQAGLDSLARLAVGAKSEAETETLTMTVFPKAQALLRQLDEKDSAFAMKSITKAFDEHLAAVAKWNDAGRRVMEGGRSDPTMEAYLKKIGYPQAPTREPSLKYSEQIMSELLRLNKQARSPETEATVIHAYIASAPTLGANNATSKELEKEVNRFVADFKGKSLSADDPRRASLLQVFDASSKHDKLKMDVADAILANKDPQEKLRWSAVKAAALMLSSTDSESAKRASGLILALPVSKDDVSGVQRILTDSMAAMSFSEDKEIQQRYFQTFVDFNKKMGIEASDQLQALLLTELKKVSPEGNRVNSTEALNERLNEAAGQTGYLARAHFEKFLTQRSKEHGEDDLELARGRMKYVDFMTKKADRTQYAHDSSETIKQCEAAIKGLQKHAPDSKELADALQILGKQYGQQAFGDLLKSEQRLKAAIEIYGGKNGDPAKHIEVLGDLGVLQARGQKVDDALKTVNTLMSLLDGADVRTKANILAKGFAILNPSLGPNGKGTDGATIAKQLLEATSKLDLDKLSQSELRQLAGPLWWVARQMDDHHPAKESYPYFEKALEMIDKAKGLSDSSSDRYSDLLGYYGACVVKKHDQARAKTIEDSLLELRKQKR